MRFFILFLLIFSFSKSTFSQVLVNGYFRKNGTYVESYYRGNPNGNPFDNFGFPGNTNPYTGKVSTGNPETYLNNYYNKKSSSVIVPTTSYVIPEIYPSNNSFKSGYSESINDFKNKETQKTEQLLKEFKLIQKTKQ